MPCVTLMWGSGYTAKHQPTKPPNMICAFEITGYREFRTLRDGGLGRINLIVGRNNSGKTFVLEAIYVLSSGGDLLTIWELCVRRGERLLDAREARAGYPPPEVDITHLFSGHDPHPGSHFTLKATNSTPERSVSFAIAEPTEKERATLPQVAVGRPTLMLHVNDHHRQQKRTWPLVNGFGLSADAVDQMRRNRRAHSTAISDVNQFISSESLRGDELIALWDKISLTANEDTVLRALRFMDPADRTYSPSNLVAFLWSTRWIHREACRHVVSNSNWEFGDGAWRMLAMAIAITQCQNGVLLIDEIDTGLHYTVMADMWKLIQRAAKEFNVQVFATSHSFDCVHSLAQICRDVDRAESEVTIQRIEIAKDRAVPFTNQKLELPPNEKSRHGDMAADNLS